MKFEIEYLKLIPTDGNKPENLICKLGPINRITLDNSTHFELFILTLIKGGLKKMIFDMENLRHLDSSGIGKIISIAKQLKILKGELVITKCPSHILETLKMVQMNKFLNIFNNNEEAMNHYKTT